MIDETCNFLYHQSTYIWDKIGFSRRKKLRISETTITEGFIFDLWQFAERAKLGIEILEAKSEKTNGNDVEIFVELGGEFASFPCQAKIMDRNGKYVKIGHRVDPDLQIDLLISYARREGAVPGYLFYNHEVDPATLTALQAYRAFELSHWGVSWAPAIAIDVMYFHYTRTGRKKVKKVPGFKTLHPHTGRPLADLICQMLHFPKPWKTELTDYGTKNGYEVKFRKDSTVRDDGDWSSFTPAGRIGFVTNADLTKSVETRGKNRPDFDPKYRIVFSLERPQRAIYSIS
ncbi:DUF6615 family protein [Mucilaginibacter aquaedulcis]|uniref:DUF6615 family protein n=1 Tax=Mucilaginibacter aquaedulcis TaxID=1187081 RepID=UPI0025B505A6|nr:DUF6615 family protein [Mucilaginibacter aquaedulcis]MDN3550999.1 hypothetical protein [Mucilaginibacter aquaedulcis]